MKISEVRLRNGIVVLQFTDLRIIHILYASNECQYIFIEYQ